MSLTRTLRVGLRREILILFPVAVLLMIVLSGFLLVSYRTAVDLAILQRQEDAAQFAARVAGSLPRDRTPHRNDLARATFGAHRAALVGPDGATITAVGSFDRPPLGPIGMTAELAYPIGIGPGESLPDVVAGYATFSRAGRSYVVRVDLRADELAFQQRALGILSWVVIGISLGVGLLVILFSRHLLRPYETLLAQARRLGDDQDEGDEMAFLTRTIERAMARFAETEPAGDADIEALQRALGPNLESGFMLLDRDAAVVSINRHGASVLGAESADDLAAVERRIDANPELAELLARAVASSSQVLRRELDVEVGDEHRTLGVTVHPLRRDDGEARAFLTLFADLTEARQIEREEKLTENLAQLGEMAAGVAHELRNSLATLRGYLTLIERRPEEESLADYLDEMRRESDHLQRVVDDFLAFARPETTLLEDVDLVELAARAASDPALGRARVRFDAPRSEVPALRGDPQLLERAVKNLIHNAVRAQEDQAVDTPVVVAVRSEGRRLELSVEDLGGGLPESIRDRLFQPFVTSRADGVGLGLTLARRIVSLHGGRLTLTDRPGGTRALIEFPVVAVDKIE